MRENHVIAITHTNDIPSKYRNTPIAALLEYHNLNRVHDTYASAQLLVGMCMDSRKQLKIPENFSFVIRAGGANLRYSDFKVSYAISIGGVRALAVIGHNQCGMVNLVGRKAQFVQGLVDAAGWDRQKAEDHFIEAADLFEIGDEIDFVVSEVQRLCVQYPKILVAPMIYRIEDNRLYLVRE